MRHPSLALTAVLLSCAEAPPPPEVLQPACPARFAAEAGTGRCNSILPAECPPGSLPVLGLAECQPVGWASCPAGFVKDTSGFACTPVLPPEPCAGASREALGSSACAPVGDCARPFPPEDAGLLVDDSFTDSQLDYRHFRSLAAALAKAPIGAVIAVEEGTYREALKIARSVEIVGRCAAKVRLESPGIGVQSSRMSVRVEGVTIRSGDLGLDLAGGSLELVDSVVEQAGDYGLVADGGATIRITGSVVRGTRSVHPVAGIALLLLGGARLELGESALSGNRGSGLSVVGAGSAATVTRSLIADTRTDGNGDFGWGLDANGPVEVVVEESAVLGSHRSGINASKGARLTVRGSVVRGVDPDGDRPYALGLSVVGANAVIERSLIADAAGLSVVAVGEGTTLALSDSVIGQNRLSADGVWGDGLYLFEDAQGSIVRTAILEARRTGIQLADPGTELTLDRVLVRGTRYKSEADRGMGIGAVAFSARLIARESVFEHSFNSGLFLGGGGRTALTGCLVRGTRLDQAHQGAGEGVVVLEGSTLSLAESEVTDNEGIGILVSESSAVVRGSRVAANPVGLHAQDGSSIEEAAEAPSVLGARQVVVTSDTIFEDNGTRLGSGRVPLPQIDDASW